MSIYVDVLVLFNIIIGYCLLSTVQKLCSVYKKTYRILLASCLAGVSSLLIILPPMPWFLAFCSRCVVCVAILATWLAPIPWRTFIKCLLWYISLNMLLAGVALFISNNTNTHSIQVNNTAVYARISPIIFIVLSFVIYFVLSMAQKILHIAPSKQNLHYPYSLTFQNCTITGTLLVDTGFSAKDIYYDKPVVLVDYEQVRNFLTAEIELALVFYYTGRQLPQKGAHFYLLPMQTAAGGVLLPCFSNACLQINKQTTSVSVAFSNNTLAQGNINALVGCNIADNIVRGNATC